MKLQLAVYSLPFCLALQKVYKTKGRRFMPVEFLTFKDAIFRYRFYSEMLDTRGKTCFLRCS